MPKKAIDYSKSCIYKICCRDPDITDIYIGSTTELTKRRYHHKSACINPNNRVKYNRPVYQYIRENGGWDNWEVVKIENYDCKCGEDLYKRERELFEILKPTLNKYRPNISAEELKELKKNCDKEYQQKNKVKIKEYKKGYYEKNKELRKICDKEYRKNNKDKIKEYREKNRESFRKKANEKITCECGSTINRGNLSTHRKTKKHIKLLEQQN